ncbi:Laccase-14 [Acorus gramineus]|uniref:Laccase n=1 Tax=Acorus gramineus TaxID=55184 RepID=A0AAV9ARL0_ACOGR|nr:Laccase-14 [Acorus gramineus]
MNLGREANKTGGEPRISDAYTMNGQPGHLYPCSRADTFRVNVELGQTYLLRIINAVMDEELFFSIAQHNITLVGTDGAYTKPLTSDYIMITPGQTMDLLLEANQPPNLYFMASRAYSSGFGVGFDRTTTTAILHYINTSHESTSPPPLPYLPPFNDTDSATAFTTRIRSLANKHHPMHVPMHVDEHLLFTFSVNLLNCSDTTPCAGPFGRRFSASVNNVSFLTPTVVDVLRSYYLGIGGVFDGEFPDKPPMEFNYTGEDLPESLLTPDFGTKAKVLEYGTSVEVVLQGTNVLAGDNHPVHLHGYSFYTVGWGFGNFDAERDPLRYNLVDPPEQNTVAVPKNGWAAIRFRADNPGVWLMHCHLERHQSWGMNMLFIVKNGSSRKSCLFPPPPDLPAC